MEPLTYIIIKEKNDYLLCYIPHIQRITLSIEKNIKKIFTTHSHQNAIEEFLSYKKN